MMSPDRAHPSSSEIVPGCNSKVYFGTTPAGFGRKIEQFQFAQYSPNNYRIVSCTPASTTTSTLNYFLHV